MAFVFGSYAKGRQSAESDFDVAVYYQTENSRLEWEERKEYREENRLWADVERIVNINTDLVVLNRAPATLAFSVIAEGIPVIIKDRDLYLRFYLKISSEAEDFRNFTKDFWEIKERSQSLSDNERNRLLRLIDFLNTELKDWYQFAAIKQSDYEFHADSRRNVERWAENIVNASIDIAKIVLASEHKPIPQTYYQTMEELVLIKGFDQQMAKKLAEFTKLRNFLAHEYLEMRYHQITKFIQDAQSLYEGYLMFVKTFLAS